MKVLVVDLSNVFWSVALGGGLKNSNAALGIVLDEIRRLASGYDRLAVVCDGKGRSFRARLWPAYKADRAQRAEHLWSLLTSLVEHCRAAGWHVFEAPETPDGWLEADDLAAAVVAWCAEHGHAVDILSGDSDLAQLVDDDRAVRMLRRYKGIAPLDADGVKAWIGVPPCAVADFKALAGDSGDGYGNIFPDLGKKTAIKMLEAAGFDAAVAVQQTIESPKDSAIGRTIKELGQERLCVGRTLSRLVATAPIDVDSLSEAIEPGTPPDMFGDMIPDGDDPALEGEPVPQAHAHEPAGKRAEPPGAPVQPSAAMTRTDASMRLILPAEEAYNRLVEFRAFVKRCLVFGTDYGKIPGCPKPVLFKPGAEKLAEIYGLAPEFDEMRAIEDWDAPLFYYKVKCRLYAKPSHVLVSECIGSCNSRETKYDGRWVFEREVPPHLDMTRLKRREFTFKDGDRAGERGVKFRVPNEEIYDQTNTILKMSQKRAMVGAVILATRSGGIFAQDVEDIPAAAYGAARDVAQWDQ